MKRVLIPWKFVVAGSLILMALVATPLYFRFPSAPWKKSHFFKSLRILNYTQPDLYLKAGEQSHISNPEFQAVVETKLRPEGTSLASVANVLRWKRKYFPFHSGGGKWVGKRTVDEVFLSKESTGCHDDALLFTAILRQIGVPAIMVESTGIQWSKNESQNPPDNRSEAGSSFFEGHVFAEAYVGSRWILVDPTSGEYLDPYDPANPVIPIQHNGQKLGYFIMKKGVDSWDYGVRSLADLQALQTSFVKEAASASISGLPTEIPVKRL